jgi:hypothetical protein
MKCTLTNRDELIAGYLSGELSEDDLMSFEEHYFQCDVCFKELNAADAAVTVIKQDGASLVSAGGPYRKRKRSGIIGQFLILPAPQRWGIALAAAAVALFFIVSIFIRTDRNVITETEIQTDREIEDRFSEKQHQSEEAISERRELFAALTGPAFEPVPYLEQWITESVRSESDRIVSFILPEIGTVYENTDIVFRWEMTEREIVSVKILNNLEEEIFVTAPEIEQFPIYTVIVQSEVFSRPGLYYWRIEDKDEVLYMGKFYFMR